MPKQKRPRSQRRELGRKLEKLALEREKLARLEPGGAPTRPLEVASASVVEARAEREPCFACGGAMRCIEHRVEEGLRVATVKCKECGRARDHYFRLTTPTLN
jgi:hypothetical protein